MSYRCSLAQHETGRSTADGSCRHRPSSHMSVWALGLERRYGLPSRSAAIRVGEVVLAHSSAVTAQGIVDAPFSPVHQGCQRINSRSA
eukprot:6186831-Amphidinium_carterae.1